MRTVYSSELRFVGFEDNRMYFIQCKLNSKMCRLGEANKNAFN
jgi:hypothetical protein